MARREIYEDQKLDSPIFDPRFFIRCSYTNKPEFSNIHC
jgi:hypothetical protein